MESLTKRISNAINVLGNDLTGAGWPEGEKDGRKFCTSTAFRELVITAGDVAGVESDLRDCVNELCLKCGQYRQEHMGACDGCRWKDVRHNG
ncbi:MAG: hypothetical protein J6S83_13920 [Lachnospiraceae bacterium]|nr:hypothetical protein [Lachnospiraceae bacterium]